MRWALCQSAGPELNSLLDKALLRAGKFGHQMVCPEHLLLALLDLSGDESERFLLAQGITAPSLEEKVRVPGFIGGK